MLWLVEFQKALLCDYGIEVKTGFCFLILTSAATAVPVLTLVTYSLKENAEIEVFAGTPYKWFVQLLEKKKKTLSSLTLEQ